MTKVTANLRFSQADITKAVLGAAKGGMIVGRVEIWPGGKIVVVSAGWTALDQPNPLDGMLTVEHPSAIVDRARATAARLKKMPRKQG